MERKNYEDLCSVCGSDEEIEEVGPPHGLMCRECINEREADAADHERDVRRGN